MHTKGVLSLSMAAVLSTSALYGQEPDGRASIDDLLRLATANNKEIQALRQRFPESRALLRQAAVRPAPTLALSGTTGRPLRTAGEEQYFASVSYTVEGSGKRSSRIEIAEVGVALARAELDERMRHLAYELSTLSAEAVAQQRKLEQLDRIIVLDQKSIQLTEARIREGDVAILDRELLAVDLGRAEAERSAAAGRLEAALAELKQLVGIGASEPLHLAAANAMPAVGDLTRLQQLASNARADLRIARLAEQQSEAEARLATAQARPDVDVTVSYSRQYARFDDQLGLSAAGAPIALRDRDDVLTLGVQIPIGTRKRNRANTEVAASRAAHARLRREDLETRVAAEVAAAHRRWSAAQSTLRILETRVIGQSEKNLDVVRQAYQLGQFRLLEVLAEQRRVVELQHGYIDAQADLAKTRAALERAAGGSLR